LSTAGFIASCATQTPIAAKPTKRGCEAGVVSKIVDVPTCAQSGHCQSRPLFQA
jgi:hypothetical protein